MRKIAYALFAVLLAVTFVATVGATGPADPKGPASHSEVLISNPGNHLIQEPAWQIAPTFDELDLIGDTLVVGNTYYNAQHNCTVSRMIDFYPDEMSVGGGMHSNVAFFTWMDKPSPTGDVHIAFNRAWYEDGEMVPEDPDGYSVDSRGVAAYATLGFNRTTAAGYPVYHGGAAGAGVYNNIVASELSILPGVFSEYLMAQPEDYTAIWPHTYFDNAQDILHVVATENSRGTDLAAPQRVFYWRNEYTGSTPEFSLGDPVLITEYGCNISPDVAASSDGDRVVIGLTYGRDYPGGTAEDWTQYNNDIYLYTSNDAGESWDDGFNLTDFLPPNPNYLPDTTLANQDTLRAYCDVNVYFDNDDVLHAAFTTSGYFSFEGTIFVRFSWIYHWDEQSNDFSLAVNGQMDCYDPGSWNRAVDRPNMYQDPVTGILYMIYQQMGLDDGEGSDTLDVSDSGFANAELGITASPPNNENGDWYGHMWAQGVNVTQTRWMGSSPAAAGEARSECNPSIALNNDGDALNVFYIMDYLGGNARQDEGEYTQNHAMWHRIPKQDVLDAFTGWTEAYPLHIDSTGHWEDPNGYTWDGDWENNFLRGDVSAPERSGLTPDQFELEQNFPNPFNPTTEIAFTLQQAGKVSLKVYDMLGREVSTLTNRTMSAGRHTFIFDGHDLASGVYFVKLQSGDFSQTRKMVLMK